ncbi:Fic family protein, partial [Pseudomonas syringae pv. tagetis]
TYALLIKYGFNVSTGGCVLNPTAVFCIDRERYYAMLAKADNGTKEGLEEWCTYVLQGIRDEAENVDRLTDYAYLTKCI